MWSIASCRAAACRSRAGSRRETPLSGRVRVLRADGTLLREMPLDDRGLCVFSFDRPQELRLDVTDDTGHRGRQPKRGRRPILITAEELLPSYAASVTGDIAVCMTSPVPPLTAPCCLAAKARSARPPRRRPSRWPTTAATSPLAASYLALAACWPCRCSCVSSAKFGRRRGHPFSDASQKRCSAGRFCEASLTRSVANRQRLRPPL